MKKTSFSKFTREELNSYEGSYEDFQEGCNRYFAQLAVDHHGSAVRDNSISELIAIGKSLESEGKNPGNKS
jgi:hypothetical protein